MDKSPADESGAVAHPSEGIDPMGEGQESLVVGVSTKPTQTTRSWLLVWLLPVLIVGIFVIATSLFSETWTALFCSTIKSAWESTGNTIFSVLLAPITFIARHIIMKAAWKDIFSEIWAFLMSLECAIAAIALCTLFLIFLAKEVPKTIEQNKEIAQRELKNGNALRTENERLRQQIQQGTSPPILSATLTNIYKDPEVPRLITENNQLREMVKQRESMQQYAPLSEADIASFRQTLSHERPLEVSFIPDGFDQPTIVTLENFRAAFAGTNITVTNFQHITNWVVYPQCVTVTWRRPIGQLRETLNRFFEKTKLLRKYVENPAFRDNQVAFTINIRRNDYHEEAENPLKLP